MKAKYDIEDDETDFHIIYSAEGSNEITKFTSLSDIDEDSYAEKIAYWNFRMKNEKFVANAPKELIEQTKARIEELTTQENVIKDLIKSLSE